MLRGNRDGVHLGGAAVIRRLVHCLADGKVGVEMTRDRIQASPEYDPSQPVNRAYEEKLYDFYGRPKYWIEV